MRRVRSGSICSILVFVAAASAPAIAAGKAPIPVSPGSPHALSPVGSRCPTFSWGPVEAAAGYEVMVYSATEDSLVNGVGLDGEATPVIRETVLGGALAWTPSSERCLEPGGAYFWLTRAVGDAVSGEWSEPLLFRVDPGPLPGDLVAAVERAVGRYLERRGLTVQPGRELAALLAEELNDGGTSADSGPPSPVVRPDHRGGRRLTGEAPEPEGVFGEDVELWLQESGSGTGDKVQLVFATPEFDGDLGDAWAIIVDAADTGGADDGRMFFSTPSFFDALQLFTDGSAILGEQREMKLRLLSSPPIACTSFLQEGLFYWDSDISALCVCDGSSWAPIDSDNMGSCS